MYAGPGSGSLLAAAAAWDALAAELETFGAGYSGVISTLEGKSWSGGAATAMAAAAAPYVAWVTATAGHAGQVASQARAAASAYEVAFAATVPPAVVVANRTLLATLVATNFLGQNTPAIAATEAIYAEMWAQDAGAMYGYVVSASAAATLASFSQPPQTTNPTGQSSQSATVGQAVNTPLGHSQMSLSQLTSAVPQRLETLASGRFTSPPASEDSMNLSATNPVTSTPNPILTALADSLGSTTLAYATPKTVFQGGSFVTAARRSGIQTSDLQITPGSTAGASAADQSCPPPGVPGSVLAGAGRAVPVGGLSVPPGWAAATPNAGASNEPVTRAENHFRALPSWADPTRTPTGTPALGQITSARKRPGSDAVFRLTDRRYRMPRPTLGG
jgi:PPE-repeat protein